MPRHYDLARMAPTTPPENMNPVCRMYLIIANALENRQGYLNSTYSSLVMDLYQEGKAGFEPERRSIRWLYECSIRMYLLRVNGSAEEQTIDRFIIAAFKDLSPLKDEVARKTFGRLCNLLRFGRGDLRKISTDSCVVWDRSEAKPRQDGSLVMNLHVSHPLIFKSIIRYGTRGFYYNDDFAKGVVLRYDNGSWM